MQVQPARDLHRQERFECLRLPYLRWDGQMAGEPEEEAWDDREQRAVRDWRIQQFLDLGFPADDALDLLRANVDYHDVERLLRLGATHAQAKAIYA